VLIKGQCMRESKKEPGQGFVRVKKIKSTGLGIAIGTN